MTEFVCPTPVVFRENCFTELEKLLEPFGASNVLVVSGKSSLHKLGWKKRIEEALGFKVLHFFDRVEAEPSLETLQLGMEVARKEKPDLILAIGGGSPLDVGKGMAVAARHSADARAFLEGEAQPREKIPFAAIPTTAGSGSEVTRASVFTDREKKSKRTLKHDLMFPELAVLDPALTESCPAAITAGCGMDALTHALESLVSKKAWALTDAVNVKALELIQENLPIAVREPKNRVARTQLLVAANLAGKTIANTGVGICHSLEAAIGGMVQIHHGTGLAILLPEVIRFNGPAAKEKFAMAARVFGEKDANGLADAVKTLAEGIGITQRLGDFGLKREDLDKVVENTLLQASVKVNPREPSKDDLQKIVEAVL